MLTHKSNAAATTTTTYFKKGDHLTKAPSFYCKQQMPNWNRNQNQGCLLYC